MRNRRIQTLPQGQQGVALIIVVFVMALVTLIAAGLGKQQNFFVKKSINQFNQQQGTDLTLSAEAFARQVLYKDWEEDKKDNQFMDDEKELWAEFAVAFPMELGLIEMQVDDLQGRFNLNSLVDAKGKVNAYQVKRLQRLLDGLGIVSIPAEKIVDWLDEDSESYEYKGAEDEAYLIGDNPYRAANGRMGHLSELMLIEGMTAEDFALLKEHVTVLPTSEAALNVNTCSKVLLMSLSEKISAESAEAIIEKRRETPFKSIADLNQLPEMPAIPDLKNVSVKTHYFSAAIRVTIGERITRLVSNLYRSDDGKLGVFSRDFGQKNIITKKQVML
jgi:general secretion pathway protein K